MHNNQDPVKSHFTNDKTDTEAQMEEELYIIELTKKLHLMQKERKKAEQDSKLLHNRLNLLKGEEDKVKELN
jgi:hypothetical protein